MGVVCPTILACIVCIQCAVSLQYPHTVMSRRRLVQGMLRKAEADAADSGDQDHVAWYNLELSPLPSTLQKAFKQSNQDEETTKFLDRCREKSDWVITQTFHSFALPVLKLFLSQTCANAILSRGSMFVFSGDQFLQLLTPVVQHQVTTASPVDLHSTDAPCAVDDLHDNKYMERDGGQGRVKGQGSAAACTDKSCRQRSGSGVLSDALKDKLIRHLKNKVLLDLGAGDGLVTDQMSQFFKKTYVTEISTWMHSHLTSKGFEIVDVAKWDSEMNQYDVISALNLFDRCDRPFDLLDAIWGRLPDGGLLITALVLPLSQYVETSTDNQPSQVINLDLSEFRGPKVSGQIVSLVRDVFTPRGFHLVSFTKLPYLCEGDMTASYYKLTDYVFVFSKVSQLNK